MEAKKQNHLGYYALGATGLTVAALGAAAMNQNGKAASKVPSKPIMTQSLTGDVASLSKKAARNWGKAGIAAGLLTAAAATVFHPKGRDFMRDRSRAFGFGGPSVEELNLQMAKNAKNDVAKLAKYAVGGLLGLGTLVGGGFAIRHAVSKKAENKAAQMLAQSTSQTAKDLAVKLEELKPKCKDVNELQKIFGQKEDAILQALLGEEGLIVEAHFPQVLKSTLGNQAASVDTVKTILKKLDQPTLLDGDIHVYGTSRHAKADVLTAILEHHSDKKGTMSPNSLDQILFAKNTSSDVKKACLDHMVKHDADYTMISGHNSENLVGRMIGCNATHHGNHFTDGQFQDLLTFIKKDYPNVLMEPKTPSRSLLRDDFSLDNFNFLLKDPVLKDKLMPGVNLLEKPANWFFSDRLSLEKLEKFKAAFAHFLPTTTKIDNAFLFNVLHIKLSQVQGKDIRPEIFKAVLDKQPDLCSSTNISKRSILQDIVLRPALLFPSEEQSKSLQSIVTELLVRDASIPTTQRMSETGRTIKQYVEDYCTQYPDPNAPGNECRKAAAIHMHAIKALFEQYPSP